jgi:type IV pilus assembly protein PilE
MVPAFAEDIMQRRQTGFTLLEVLVTVAIVGILSAIALPAYSDYVMRGRLTEAFSTLSAAQPNLEQFWSNQRTYNGFDAATSNAFPAATPNFTYSLSNATNSGYLLTATGRAAALNFAFTIDQQGNRVTTSVPSGWTSNSACWVDRRSGTCSQ